MKHLYASTIAGRLAALALAAAALAGTSAQAVDVVVDVASAQSVDELGQAGNTVITRDIGAYALVGSLAWNVTLTAYDPSWLQDMRLRIANTQGVGITLTLDSLQAAGTKQYIGSGNLVDLGLSFAAAGDGILRLEFFESYKDFGPGVADGQWDSGTLSFSVMPAAVPEPAVAGLLALGLLVPAARRAGAPRSTRGRSGPG
jgi:hypothetical protein